MLRHYEERKEADDMNKQTRKITEGAMMCAIVGLVLFINRQLGNMLEYFMYNQGRVLSREMIEDHVWNFDYEGGTNIVDVYISYLRKKIDDGYDKKLIHTVRGRGFIMREEI